MEILIKVCWIALAAIHLGPAAVAFRPSLVKTLYGLEAGGPLAVLLTHRGVLFVAVMGACILAALDPGTRRAAALVTAISVLGFLIVYARAGFPTGPLRSIARVDVIAALPLALVIYDAWFRAKGCASAIVFGMGEVKMKGGCHCGAVRYVVTGEQMTHALCHCSDCRRHAGAPMVGWAMVQEGQLTITQGQTKIYASSEHGRRLFCQDCGTSLFYTNAQNLPGIIDIQSGTLDDPEGLPAQCHIQTAERLVWLATSNDLPQFERFPTG